MSLRIAKHAAGLFIVCSLIAWGGARAAGSEAACCSLSGGCAGMTDQEILDRAFNNGTNKTNFGTCYFHDQSTCPTCACKYYVKVSYYGGQQGYDGGTGCLNDIATVAATLRQLCEDGVCCCPKKVPTSPCSTHDRVWAKDPATGSCCEYANACAAPTGWPLYPNQTECEGWKPASVE